MRGYESVVVQFRIRLIDAVDFLPLPWRKRFVRIQTPYSRQKPLTMQDFVKAWNASCEGVRGVEEGGIAVCYASCPGQEFVGNREATVNQRVDFVEQFDCLFRPDRPMAEQTAPDAALLTAEHSRF